MENVSLTISKEIVQPIVQAKINEAILAAMGGQNQLIEKAIHTILYDKVDHKGAKSSYHSENKHNWIDIVITKQIEEAVKSAMAELLADKQGQIKDAILKQLSTKRALESFASSLLDNAAKVQQNYYSTVKVEFTAKNSY
jgi:ABC-type Zn2+ transport system substrate-binding protein/surface adhesin